MSKHDEISDLLDSIENDDTLERKMHAFKAKKDQISRIERKQQEQQIKKEIPKVVEKTSDTVVMQPVQDTIQQGEANSDDVSKTRVMDPSLAGGSTMVFDSKSMEEAKPNSDDTVVLDDVKLQTMAHQTQSRGPQLQRRVVASSKKPSKQIGTSNKEKVIVGVIAALVGILVLVGCINLAKTGSIFGLFNPSTQQNANTHTAGYSRLLNWIKGYDGLSDSDKLDITTYKNIYDKLTSAEKKKIDSLLQSSTGKSFNTLVNEANKKKKNSSKNNNVKSAEQKAKIRAQIHTLQSQLKSAQSDLDTANTQISTVQSQMQTIQSQMQAYQDKVTQYQNDVTKLQQEISQAGDGEDTSSLKQQLEAAQQKLNDAQSSTEYTNLQSKYDSLQNDLSTYQSNQATAQQNVDYYNSQISLLQQELNALN